MNKPPAFQFYAADFLVDAAVKLMTLEERGAYVTLLAHAWIEGALPAALAKLAKLCEVPVADIERMWPAISVCWKPAEREGFIVNPRLEKERRKQATYRKSQSDKAKAQQARQRRATDRIDAEPVPSSPSPSLSPSPESKASDTSYPGDKPPTVESNPMKILGPLIRQHLYRDTKPPEGWNPRRCADICTQLLKRHSVDDLAEAIRIIPLIRARKVACDDSLQRWFAKQPHLTMRALNDQWGSGSVMDQLLHIAMKADTRPVARDVLGAA